MVCASITHPGSRSDQEASLSVLVCHLEEVVAVVLVAVCCPAPPVVVKQQRDRVYVGCVKMQRYVEPVVAGDLNIGENDLSSLGGRYYLTHHRIHELYLFVMRSTCTNIHVRERQDQRIERISMDLDMEKGTLQFKQILNTSQHLDVAGEGYFQHIFLVVLGILG